MPILHSFRKKFTSQPFNASCELRKTKSTGNLSEAQVNTQDIPAKHHAQSITNTTAKAAPHVRKHDKEGHPEQSSGTSDGTASSNTHKGPSDEGDNKSNSSTSSSSNSSTTRSSSLSSVSSGPQKRPQLSSLPEVHYPTLHRSNSSPCTPHEESDAAKRMNYFTSHDLELLLSMETQARLDAQEARARENASAETQTTRPTRLKFELPAVPARDRSPIPPAYAHPRQRWAMPDQGTLDNAKRKKSKKSRRSRWGRLMGNSDNEKSDSERALAVGDKVRLTRRPLPTLGHIRYIGPLDSSPGQTWYGVELESRVGANDGSIDGRRYFQTDPHRGIFLTENELTFA